MARLFGIFVLWIILVPNLLGQSNDRRERIDFQNLHLSFCPAVCVDEFNSDVKLVWNAIRGLKLRSGSLEMNFREGTLVYEDTAYNLNLIKIELLKIDNGMVLEHPSGCAKEVPVTLYFKVKDKE